MAKPRVCCVVGTRPEAIKMAPLIARLRAEEDPTQRFETQVVATGQHEELCTRALGEFGIQADRTLSLAGSGRSLAETLAIMLEGLSSVFRTGTRPDIVLAQGDTTSVLAAALASSYDGIPFGHVEAGLRSSDPREPFPEEMHRVLISKIAFRHFAPSAIARDHLIREGVDPRSVHLVGNTVIDALRTLETRTVGLPFRPKTERFLLTTVHRRENQGAPLRRICRAIAALVDRDRALSVVWPVHPNPNIRQSVFEQLGGRDRVHLLDPIGYGEFLSYMKESTLILSDSGGVQEEGPAFGKPVVVLREATERPEALAAGSSILAGSNPRKIVSAVERLLRVLAVDPNAFRPFNPWGDGRASDRIVRILQEILAGGTNRADRPARFEFFEDQAPDRSGSLRRTEDSHRNSLRPIGGLSQVAETEEQRQVESRRAGIGEGNGGRGLQSAEGSPILVTDRFETLTTTVIEGRVRGALGANGDHSRLEARNHSSVRPR